MQFSSPLVIDENIGRINAIKSSDLNGDQIPELIVGTTAHYVNNEYFDNDMISIYNNTTSLSAKNNFLDKIKFILIR